VIARLAVAAALAVAAGGCGGDGGGSSPVPTTTPSITQTASPPADTAAPPAATVSGANAYIGSIAVDPGGGTVMLGTGLGLFRLRKGATDAKRVTGEVAVSQGSGQVSSNLVVRYAGPGDLIASGHPESGTLPENLGLMRSHDAGATWAPIAELGESDYHILQAAGRHVVGVRADELQIRISDDGGRTFEQRTPPDTPLDVAFDPGDAKGIVVTTKQGVYSSADGGGSWRERDTTTATQLAWARPDALYRADPGGAIKASADGGATWKEAGSVGMEVNELAADAGGSLYTSVAGGEVRRSVDGGAHWSRLVKLK
jgi:hypothetical protein